MHRDIKPENILIDEDGHAKLADFGIMKSIEKTLAKTQGGSPYYMAPEVALGKGYSCSVDIWSLCATFYHVFKGIPPYFNSSVKSEYQLILRKRDPANYDPLTIEELPIPKLVSMINDNLILDDVERLTADEMIIKFNTISFDKLSPATVSVKKTEIDESEIYQNKMLTSNNQLLESEVGQDYSDDNNNLNYSGGGAGGMMMDSMATPINNDSSILAQSEYVKSLYIKEGEIEEGVKDSTLKQNSKASNTRTHNEYLKSLYNGENEKKNLGRLNKELFSQDPLGLTLTDNEESIRILKLKNPIKLEPEEFDDLEEYYDDFEKTYEPNNDDNYFFD